MKNKSREYGSVVQWADPHHPYADRKAIEAILDFSASMKPTYHLFIGDCLNLGGISRHVMDDFIAQYEEPVLEGLIQFGKHLDTVHKINPKSKIVWIWGNHDERLRAFVKKHPSWRGILDDPIKLLRNFGECKVADKIELVQFDDPEQSYSIGKMSFVHGYFCGKHTASQHVEAYVKSITFGHTHTMQQFCTVRGGTEPLAGFSIGHLMDKEGRKYLKGRPHRWVTGFAFMEYNKSSGNYTQHLLPIVNGKFIFNGREYGGA